MAGDSNEGKSHQVDVKSEHHAAATTQAQLEAHDRAMQPTSSNGIHGQHGKSASQADSPTGEVSGALTIAFLKCDSLPDSLLEKGQTYRAVVHNLFEPMLEGTSLKLETKSYDAIKRELPTDADLEETDAIIVSGSFEDDADTDQRWILALAGHLIMVHDRYPHIRIIGICFGLQILARAFGPAPIVKNPKGWEIGSTQVDLTALGRTLIWGPGDDAPHHIMTQQIHADIVESCPEDFELLGSSELTPIQGICKLYDGEVPAFRHSEICCVPTEPWRRVHIYAFQGHPEWGREIIEPFIDEYEAQGVLKPDFAEAARGRTREVHDGAVLGRSMLAVMGVGDRCRNDVKGHVIEKEKKKEEQKEEKGEI